MKQYHHKLKQKSATTTSVLKFTPMSRIVMTLKKYRGIRKVSEALSAAFTGSEAYSRAAYSRAESLCHSSILNGYLSDASEQ